MSFEAVPCMLKRRQEDGNEAQLFGLLIRTTAQTQQVGDQRSPRSDEPQGEGGSPNLREDEGDKYK